MMIKTLTAGKTRVLIAGALAILSQSAWSDRGPAANSDLRLSIPQPRIEIATPKIEASAEAHIETLKRRIAEDLAASLAAIGDTRFELVTVEVPTRG